MARFFCAYLLIILNIQNLYVFGVDRNKEKNKK